MSDRPTTLPADPPPGAERDTGRRALGWGTKLAVAGIAIFAVGLLFIGWAYDSMTVDQPGQWTPIIVALGVMAILVVGLALGSRLAFALAVALAAYQLVTAALGIVRTGMVGPWQFGLISLVPAVLVLVGLASSWRAYWRPTR